MRILHNKKGTSLAEVLVAFLIITVMSTVLAGAILTSTKSMQLSSQMEEARIDEMESCDGILNMSDSDFRTTVGVLASQDILGVTLYRDTLTVSVEDGVDDVEAYFYVGETEMTKLVLFREAE